MHYGGTRQRDGLGSAVPPVDRHAEPWDWQLLARCRGADPSMFFHGDGERGLKRRRRERKAKAFCAGCSVVVECREHALTFQEPFGIWGGLTEAERDNFLGRTHPSGHS